MFWTASLAWLLLRSRFKKSSSTGLISFNLRANQPMSNIKAMASALTANDEAQLSQTIEMFEVITQTQPMDYQSLEILKEAYLKLGRHDDVIITSKRIAEAYVQL